MAAVTANAHRTRRGDPADGPTNPTLGVRKMLSGKRRSLVVDLSSSPSPANPGRRRAERRRESPKALVATEVARRKSLTSAPVLDTDVKSLRPESSSRS
jgi:hypothetical protein